METKNDKCGCIAGRLARDPELRQTNTGKQVARFTLAVDRGRKDANGQSQTDWINVIAWERLADFAYKYLSKGQMVNVDGRLQSSSYTAKDGTNRTALEVVANNINFCGSKADNAAQGSPARRAACRCTGLQPGPARTSH